MEKVTIKSLNMTFVPISPGTFMMGSPESEPGRSEDEIPHDVTLTEGYYIQSTPITQGQWQAVMVYNPSHFKKCGENCPVENVSWEDVQVFIQILNQRDKSYQYRLPTEAEWEYAVRAGTTTPFSFGDTLSTDQANYDYDGNYPYVDGPKEGFQVKITPVASFAPNAWGVYDMHGNVWEWCQDRYGDYPNGSVTDPKGPSSGDYRVLRGGCWLSASRLCRSASRLRFHPGYRDHYIGFRLVAQSFKH